MFLCTSRASCKPGDMELLIRPAQADDVAALHHMMSDLENQLLPLESFTAIFLKNLADERIGYFLAESSGEAVGMVSCHVQGLLHHAAPVAEIQEMYVSPELRSQRIGQHLLEAAKLFALQRGAGQLEVTSNQLRTNAHRFYEREGFLKTHYKLVRKLEKE